MSDLPFVPRHLDNAFLEDWVHDYTVNKTGMLNYYSRVQHSSVWILIEYK